jgi:hypothetical protein
MSADKSPAFTPYHRLVRRAAGSGKSHCHYKLKTYRLCLALQPVSHTWPWSVAHWYAFRCTHTITGVVSKRTRQPVVIFPIAMPNPRWENRASLSTNLLGSIPVLPNKPLSRWSNLAALSFEAA